MIRAIALTVCVALIAVDQLLKVLAMAALTPPKGAITVVEGLFNLTYIENRGAAFGLFQGGTTVLGIISVVVLLGLLGLLLSGKIKETMLIWSLTLIIAGGLGNCIDRFSRGFVVDYLDFSALFGFPVFNFADCCVVVGTGLILFYVLFVENKSKTKADSEDDNKAERKDLPKEGPTNETT